jgi:hypothetical protein
MVAIAQPVYQRAICLTFRFHFPVQHRYLDVTVQEKLRSGWPGPFVKVEGCCD